MLRLVATREPFATSSLRRVAICGVDDELANYIEYWLRKCWPDVIVRRAAHFEALDLRLQQLVVCSAEPGAAIQIPTLWLSDIDRKADVFRITRWLWRSATPITGRRLLRMVDSILAAAS